MPNFRLYFSLFALPILTTAAHAQAFEDRKSALVDYSKADTSPRKTCEAIGKSKPKEIVSITAMEVAAASGTPAHCRVTGVLSPEIAFEVSLPAKWNGRFYMIGNGGHAGEALPFTQAPFGRTLVHEKTTPSQSLLSIVRHDQSKWIGKPSAKVSRPMPYLLSAVGLRSTRTPGRMKPSSRRPCATVSASPSIAVRSSRPSTRSV